MLHAGGPHLGWALDFLCCTFECLSLCVHSMPTVLCQIMDIAQSDSVKVVDGKQPVAELISSGLLQRLLPLLAIRDLQSLLNVSVTLRQLTDSLTQPEWRAVPARIVPASHYLADVASGQPRAAGVCCIV